MLLRLVLLLTLVPIVEVILLVQIHHGLASLWGSGIALAITIGMIVLTGVAGAILAKSQGVGVLARIRAGLTRGEAPAQSIVDGVLVLLGAALLLTPGVLTDVVGFSLLIPLSRAFYRRGLIAWFQEQVRRGAVRIQTLDASQPTSRASDDVIDAAPPPPGRDA